ncbi:PREDICTED: uncharacterized protein LOC108685962 [Atta colombica]|uniref:uncharacterized protein LOC108685962 n=1 Tax=Atta colombica TaxID=520822 RepID=UPI00084CBCD6|nr:PREDICTED: uncharacterized protein LOC108685962 [Atta colombica]
MRATDCISRSPHGCWKCLQFGMNLYRGISKGNGKLSSLSNRGLTLYGYDEGFTSILNSSGVHNITTRTTNTDHSRQLAHLTFEKLLTYLHYNLTTIIVFTS